ncbi:MAG: hypothetical protein JHD00_10590 [Akkermansiaceae bacterium]|nr:hypothetical protein [Akkermansiaceae bacterium]
MDRRYALISSRSWRCRSFLGPPFYSPSPAPTRRPNIVMILIDDMGWGDFSCFGNKDTKPLTSTASPPRACASSSFTSPHR